MDERPLDVPDRGVEGLNSIPGTNFVNFRLHSSPFICYKQFTESSGVASRSYCLQLSGSSGI